MIAVADERTPFYGVKSGGTADISSVLYIQDGVFCFINVYNDFKTVINI